MSSRSRTVREDFVRLSSSTQFHSYPAWKKWQTHIRRTEWFIEETSLYFFHTPILKINKLDLTKRWNSSFKVDSLGKGLPSRSYPEIGMSPWNCFIFMSIKSLRTPGSSAAFRVEARVCGSDKTRLVGRAGRQLRIQDGAVLEAERLAAVGGHLPCRSNNNHWLLIIFFCCCNHMTIIYISGFFVLGISKMLCKWGIILSSFFP